MNVLDVRIFPALLLIDDAPQVRLPELIAAAAQAASKFDSMVAQRLLAPRPQAGIRPGEHQRERVVAASLDCEIGLVFLWIEEAQEQFQVGGAHFILGIESFELAAA